MNMEKVRCSECGRDVSDGRYGIYPNGEHYCYECCGKMDKEALKSLHAGEKMCLYLTQERNVHGVLESYVINWPGTLRIRVAPRVGRHNMAGVRRDVWFDYAGGRYHGVQYGNNSEICHVKRLG